MQRPQLAGETHWAGQVCIRMHKLLAAFVVVWSHHVYQICLPACDTEVMEVTDISCVLKLKQVTATCMWCVSTFKYATGVWTLTLKHAWRARAPPPPTWPRLHTHGSNQGPRAPLPPTIHGAGSHRRRVREQR